MMIAIVPAQPRRGHSPSVRTRRPLDVSEPGVLESVGADQIAYYRARAAWYDDAYECLGDYDRGPELNAQWLSDLDQVERALSEAPLHGDCVELGAGTGYWSERVIDKVEALWALDSGPEALSIARARVGARATKVMFETVDLWKWQPTRVWDSAVAFFFLEHVPDEVLPGLLTALHDALRPGAPFFVAEGAAQDFAPVLERRSIEGRGYDVVERRRTTQEFEAAFETAGFAVRAAAEERLVHLMATRD
jgi:demethylmenaquinone methyltransferase/2-methoxy-6-polyprenyl-1,4-benzoquinol methylase